MGVGIGGEEVVGVVCGYEVVVWEGEGV